jgi:hypothetical protein
MTIFNGTPHDINIYENSIFNADIRKYQGGDFIATIPSNGMLNAKIETDVRPKIGNIPIFGKKLVSCDMPPQGYDIVIVSALYSSAVKQSDYDYSNCYTVCDPVFTSDGKTIIGCLGLAPLF